MQQYDEFVKSLRESFIERNYLQEKNFWNSEIKKVSEILNINFSPSFHPHFFSGDYYEKMFIGITMNPCLRKNLDFNNTYSDYLEKLSFNEFIEEQKNRFNTFLESSEVYGKFETLIKKLNPLIKDSQIKQNDSNWKYPLLAKNGAAIDIFPFYSHSFTIKFTPKIINLIREYYYRIHQKLLEIQTKKRIIIILSGQITNALLKEKGGRILHEPFTIVLKNKLMGRWGTSYMYILEDKKKMGKIYAVSNWNRYIPDDLLNQYAKIILQTSYKF